MNSVNNVLLIGFDEKIEEKVHFFSNDVNLRFIQGTFESLQHVTSNEKRLVEFDKIIFAPEGQIYFPEFLEINPLSSENKNACFFIKNEKIVINDRLIFDKLGIIDLVLDTRYRKSESLIQLFLPDISDIEIDPNQFLLKLRTTTTSNVPVKLQLNNSERQYLGTLALYSFINAFRCMDNFSVITPESHYPDKYYLNFDISSLTKNYNLFSDFDKFYQNSGFESEFHEALKEWDYEKISLKANQNKNIFNHITKANKPHEKSCTELKKEFLKSFHHNQQETYSKLNIIDISFKSFYDVPSHYMINHEKKNFSNPIICIPKYTDINDALYTMLPFIYPVINENEFYYSIEGENFKYDENDWPPKTDIFLNKIKTDFNKNREKENKPIFIGNSKNLTYWANEIAVTTRTTKGHVLVSGETGSGKEMTAEIIHYFSSVKNTAENLITVNCADIPENLADSILFGHVKGAFTSAIGNKEGLIFKNQQGSVFLDEINQLPKETLGKLLRFMETGEFYKLGSEEVSRSAARIIAATNSQDFINDKFLNSSGLINRFMFSVSIPALRYRVDDIPILAEYFWNNAINDYKMKKDRIISDMESLIFGLHKKKEKIIKKLSLRLWINSNVRGLRNEVYNIINRFIAIEELKAPSYEARTRNKRKEETVTYISDEDFINILRNAINRKSSESELKSILLKTSNGGYSSISSVKMKLSRMKKRGFTKESEIFQKEFTKNGRFKEY